MGARARSIAETADIPPQQAKTGLAGGPASHEIAVIGKNAISGLSVEIGIG